MPKWLHFACWTLPCKATLMSVQVDRPIFRWKPLHIIDYMNLCSSTTSSSITKIKIAYIPERKKKFTIINYKLAKQLDIISLKAVK